MKRTQIKVICPAEKIITVKDMEIVYVPDSEKPFPYPCNGCEDFNNSETCQRCTAGLTLMFYEDPQRDTTHPLVPKKL